MTKRERKYIIRKKAASNLILKAIGRAIMDNVARSNQGGIGSLSQLREHFASGGLVFGPNPNKPKKRA